MAIRGRAPYVCLLSAVILMAAGMFRVNAYKSGAAESACSSLIPGHGGSPQTSASPYQITTSSTSYSAGQSIEVTLFSTDGSDFKGFLLVARNTNANSVGTFDVSSTDIRTACSSAGVTHSNSNLKSTVTVNWTSPATSATGSVTFTATVVKNYSHFWVNVESAAISEATSDVGGGSENMTTPSTDVSTPTTSASSSPDDVDTSGCDETKACFRVPDDCTTNCNFILTWRIAGPAVSFEMSASVPSNNYWVAFGLSIDQKMGDDNVIDCLFNDETGTFIVQASRNVGRSNEVLSDPTLGLVSGTLSGSVNNGRITCRFQRLRSVATATNKRRRSARQAASDTLFSLDESSYFILLAKGPVSEGLKLYHSNNRIVSTTSINITASSGAVGLDQWTKLILIKTHGCLMLIAWMVFASFGMLMPRYFKSAWPYKTWCGKKIWFQIHQPFMAITLILTAAAFVAIFVAVRDYSQLTSPTFAHPPLGIAVMALVIINPIMAIFRPEPNAKKRPIFNIFHFLVGLIAHVASVVTMFLGLYMPQLDLPVCRAIMSAYICFHVLIEIILAVHMNAKCCCQRNSSEFKSTVLIVHLGGVVGCCILIVIMIAVS